MRLSLKLFLTTLLPYLICVPTVILLGYWNDKKIILEREIAEANARVTSKANLISATFSDWQSDLEVMARTREMREGTISEKIAYMRNEQSNGKTDGLYFTEASGNVHSTSGSTFRCNDREFYPQIKAGNETITNIIMSRGTGKPVVLILVPVRANSGKVLGSLGMTILYRDLLDKIHNARMIPGEWTFLLDENKGPIRQLAIEDNIRFVNSEHTQGDPVEMDQKLASVEAAVMPNNVPKPIDLNGKPYFAFVKSVPGSPFKVISLRAESELYKSLIYMQRGSILIAIITLSIAIASTLAFHRSIVRPIRSLIEAHKKFGRGQKNIRAMVEGEGEIAELRNSFNAMADRLNEEERERFAAETKARDANLHLLRSVKLASIGEIAAGVAHEINNPLAIIQGNLERMGRLHQGMPNRPPELDNLTTKVNRATMRIRKIVEELRMFVRKDPERVEVFSVHESIEDSLNMLQNILQSANVRLVTKFCAQELRVKGSQDKFQQVIFNIVTNARDAIEPSGCGVVTVFTSVTGDQVFIEIADNGPGISPAHTQKIFDPFFTTKPKGTGLGLAISHTLIAEMKGKLSVTSTPHIGTTFTIQLPLSSEAITSNKTDDNKVVPKFVGRALILDDDAEVGEILAEMLNDLGIMSVATTNWCEASEQLQKGSFQWLFSDQQLPQYSGLQLIEMFAEQGILPPAVYLITGGVQLDLSRTKPQVLSHIRGVLYKPFSRRDLIQQLVPANNYPEAQSAYLNLGAGPSQPPC